MRRQPQPFPRRACRPPGSACCCTVPAPAARSAFSLRPDTPANTPSIQKTQKVGPDAVAFLARTAPELVTDPPPLVNTGSFELGGWTAEEGGEALHGPPPHVGPARYEAGDPAFDADLDG